MNSIIQAAPVNLPRFTPRDLIPTQEQIRIALARDKVVLIEANAGAAKTTTLALRIGEALARKLAPELILALTFTPQARDVMRARLIEIGIPEASAARIAIMTFEDFAAKVLARSEGGSAEHCTQARQLKQYALAAIEQVGRQHAQRYDFLDLKTHHIALSQFFDVQLELKATMALQRSDLADLEYDEAAAALNVPLTDYLSTIEYERIRLGSHEEALFRGPFDATYDLACSLAEDGEPMHLPAYRLVICDELHDLNEAAFRILNDLLKPADCYFVGAGDKDQVIHSRLGASEQYLQHRFASSYPALARYRLTLSYRHGPHLAHAMAQFKQKEVDSALPLHTTIRQSHYDGAGAISASACAVRVIEALAQWKRDKLPLDGCAILVRERHQSVAIENALMQAGIAYRTPGMAGYLQREEILFLRGMIAIALKNLATIKSIPVRRAIVEALAIFGELDMTPQDLLEAQNMIARDPDTLRFFFSGQLVRSKSGGAGQRIASAVAYLEGVAPETPADSVLHEICSQINLETLARRIYVHPVEASVVSKSVAGLIAAASASKMNLRDFSEWLGTAEAFVSHNRSKHQVVLDCVANAKGKEFDHVILPFLEVGEFPHALFARKQEENLFYVAATRARARLTLISPLAAAQRSIFIEQMKLGAIEAGANAALAANEARAAASQGNTGKSDRTASAGQAASASNGQSGSQGGRHELKVPYAEKNDAKALGAEWDATRKVWHVAAGVDLKPFARWLRT
jgi:DNA helicase-2/ATP-dependent DNA helicase PcrA